MSTNTTKLDLLLKEIDDAYVQENFYRLKLYLEQLAVGNTTIVEVVGGSSGGAGSSTSIWSKKTVLVPPTSTVILDSVPLASFGQLEYIINYLNTFTKAKSGLKMTVLNDDSTIEEQVYAKSGAPLNLGLFANPVGINCEISLQNNETSAVEVSFAKLNIP